MCRAKIFNRNRFAAVGPGFRSEERDRVAYVYKTEGEVIECELLHEFLEAYQIHYVDSETGEVVEKVVSRDHIREIGGS